MFSEVGKNGHTQLTFAILGYNQEHFIREAISGALFQTYSPLEIILSDDCSVDRTFAIMCEMAGKYTGPHRIILNRNTENLGLGRHINKIMDLSSGELVVLAAGDDISLPERTSVIYRAWEYSGRKVTSIYSDYTMIDRFGNPYQQIGDPGEQEGVADFQIQQGDLRNFIATRIPMVFGCTHACSPLLFRLFGQLPPYLTEEDVVLSFRSLAVEGILYIRRPLVKYRRHEQNLSFHSKDTAPDFKSRTVDDAKRSTMLHAKVTSYSAIIQDIDVLRGMNKHGVEYLADVERQAKRVRELHELERELIAENFLARMHALLKIVFIAGLKTALKLSPQILERRLYHHLRAIKWAARDHLSRQLY